MPNRLQDASTYTSRMRVTPAGRPFAKDLADIFAAMTTQLKIGTHRHLFRSYQDTFTTEEACDLLADLGVTHVLRQLDPDDPSKHIATRATTRFSMARPIAKGLLQHFLNAGFMSSAVDSSRTVRNGSIFDITNKGLGMIKEFSVRAQVDLTHMDGLFQGADPEVHFLERLPTNDDALALTKPNLIYVFRAMMRSLPAEALLPDDVGGLQSKDLQQYRHTFYGSQCFEWIWRHMSVVSRDEADTVACEFGVYGWIKLVKDKSDGLQTLRQESHSVMQLGTEFNTSRNAIYYMTDKGQEVIDSQASSTGKPGAVPVTAAAGKAGTANEGADKPPELTITPTQRRRDSAIVSVTEDLNRLTVDDSPIETDDPATVAETEVDTNWKRLFEVIEDPLQRHCFREFLRSKYCEENLNFHLDFQQVRKKKAPATSSPLTVANTEAHSHTQPTEPSNNSCASDNSNQSSQNINSSQVNQGSSGSRTMSRISECYGIYDKYLSPDAIMEVNIEHGLRQIIIQYATEVFAVVSHDDTSTDLPFFSSSTDPRQQSHVVVVAVQNGNVHQVLKALLNLYNKVNKHVCRIMAEDSIPKFIRSQKYKDLCLSQGDSNSSSRSQRSTSVSSGSDHPSRHPLHQKSRRGLRQRRRESSPVSSLSISLSSEDDDQDDEASDLSAPHVSIPLS